MDLFLRILGGICLAGFTLGVLLLLLLWGLKLVLLWALKRNLTGLADQLKYTVVPPRVHLVRQPVVAWKDAPAVESLAQPLRDAGFEEAGFFETREMDYLRVLGLAHPGECLYAAIYEHDAAGVFMDLVTRYEDGTSFTYSTAAQGGELRERPGHRCVREPGLGAAELLRRMLAERPQASMSPATPEHFQADFERAYAESMDWRNSQPFDPEEVRRTAGRDLTEEELDELREAHETRAYEGLNEALRDRFSQQVVMTGSEWNRVQHRLLFIHDRLTVEQVAALFGEWYDDRLKDNEARVNPDFTTEAPRPAFARVNAGLPAERQFRKLGEVAEPVPADVYVAPEGPAFWSEDEDEFD